MFYEVFSVLLRFFGEVWLWSNDKSFQCRCISWKWSFLRSIQRNLFQQILSISGIRSRKRTVAIISGGRIMKSSRISSMCIKLCVSWRMWSSVVVEVSITIKISKTRIITWSWKWKLSETRGSTWWILTSWIWTFSWIKNITWIPIYVLQGKLFIWMNSIVTWTKVLNIRFNSYFPKRIRIRFSFIVFLLFSKTFANRVVGFMTVFLIFPKMRFNFLLEPNVCLNIYSSTESQVIDANFDVTILVSIGKSRVRVFFVRNVISINKNI